MLRKAATLVFVTHALAATVESDKRADCPNIHVFGARETTAPAGYGTAGTVVNLILQAFPGATSEAITYPACGGQSQCGGVSYANSVIQGTTAVATAVNNYNARCPDTQIVVVGYSQGGQIANNAFCGGGDTNEGLTSTAANTINAAAANMVKAVIEMGSPRFINGLAYNVGTCTTKGFAPRPAGFVCPGGAKVQSYCDAADPYCCTGNDANTHQGYGNKYGQAALTFVKGKLNQSGSTPVTPDTSTTASPPPATNPTPPAGGEGTVQKWGQCGGSGWTGPTTCAAGTTCTTQNEWYSQCL
ncbi:carbohydrate-binding module family 1 protein [Patellaria atrata CBS 101060]|uniref:Carbohydrate-binding module family 1 protein n=1 Tax=Patellaria atrata CBS 101060 TaxID=1346257 RepID=A0A9P4S853_9PEZI|nr:carbohydrate-binding module family 1 protein [Patellaria atrata CBS 101060]